MDMPAVSAFSIRALSHLSGMPDAEIMASVQTIPMKKPAIDALPMLNNAHRIKSDIAVNFKSLMRGL